MGGVTVRLREVGHGAGSMGRGACTGGGDGTAWGSGLSGSWRQAAWGAGGASSVCGPVSV